MHTVLKFLSVPNFEACNVCFVAALMNTERLLYYKADWPSVCLEHKIVAGLTGEGMLFTVEERKRLAEKWLEVGKGK